MIDTDVVAELHRLIFEQTNDLWFIASGPLIFELVVVALVVRVARASVEANGPPCTIRAAASPLISARRGAGRGDQGQLYGAPSEYVCRGHRPQALRAGPFWLHRAPISSPL